MVKFILKGFSLILGMGFHLLYQLRAWARKSPLAAVITAFVVSFHLIIILLVGLQRHANFSPKKLSPLVVNTIKEAPPPAKKPAIIKTVTQKAKPPISKPKPTPKPAPSKVAQRKKELLNQLDKSLTKIDQNEVKSNTAPTLAVPHAIETKSDRESEMIVNYQSELITFLRDVLILPKVGEVKVKLIANCEGKISFFEILWANSPENALYLKNKLPLLTIPCFNRDLIHTKQLSFIITFSGE